MGENKIVFLVVITLSVLSFIASICVLLYHKRKIFSTDGKNSVAKLAKIFTTVTVAVNASLLITFAATLFSTMILPVFIFMGLILFFVACGASIIIGPAVSLLGIVFSVVSMKEHDKGKRTYIFISCLSMLISLIVVFLYMYLTW